MIESFAIDLTISLETEFGAETPINTSEFLITSSKDPDSLLGFVICANSSTDEFLKVIFLCIAPSLLQTIMFLTPEESNNLHIAVPAAPAPFITIFKSLRSFFTIFKAFNKPAKVTIAVPCWSS
ncbi:hypothetical protein D3C73_712630 [compost metagenome]